jgi:hypothetical protein
METIFVIDEPVGCAQFEALRYDSHKRHCLVALSYESGSCGEFYFEDLVQIFCDPVSREVLYAIERAIQREEVQKGQPGLYLWLRREIREILDLHNE